MKPYIVYTSPTRFIPGVVQVRALLPDSPETRRVGVVRSLDKPMGLKRYIIAFWVAMAFGLMAWASFLESLGVK